MAAGSSRIASAGGAFEYARQLFALEIIAPADNPSVRQAGSYSLKAPEHEMKKTSRIRAPGNRLESQDFFRGPEFPALLAVTIPASGSRQLRMARADEFFALARRKFFPRAISHEHAMRFAPHFHRDRVMTSKRTQEYSRATPNSVRDGAICAPRATPGAISRLRTILRGKPRANYTEKT